MTGGKKGCVLLHHVNKKRSELHPDWLPVRVTEDYEIVWQDVARPVDAEDFHALKSTVEGLIASKAELEKRVRKAFSDEKADRFMIDLESGAAELRCVGLRFVKFNSKFVPPEPKIIVDK